MFAYCQSLEELDLSSFNTSKVATVYAMLACCNNLRELDLSSFVVSESTEVKNLIMSCNHLETLSLSTSLEYRFDELTGNLSPGSGIRKENLKKDLLNIMDIYGIDISDVSKMYEALEELSKEGRPKVESKSPFTITSFF